MSIDPAAIDPELREELVAYLDGELDATARRRIEQRLADEPPIRVALSGLERTWKLLDDADGPGVDDNFTQTTLEMVAVEAAADAEHSTSKGIRRRGGRRILWGAGVVVAGLAGFLAVILLVPDPNRQLLQDLGLWVRLDEYRQVDSLDFVRTLAKEKLFVEDNDEDAEDAAPPLPMQFEAMNSAEKSEVVRHAEEFRALPQAEQERIRQFHEQLDHDHSAEKLGDVLTRYSRWLATLPPFRRAELSELDSPKRLKQIRRLLDERTKVAPKRLPAKDCESVVRWLDLYATRHEAKLLETLAEPRRRQVARLSAVMRHRIALGILCQRWMAGNPAAHPPVSEAELADLRSRLSPESQARLVNKPSTEPMQTMVAWLRPIARQELQSRRGDASLLPGFDEQLADFFEFQLGVEERDRLLCLPGDEMQQRLRELYLVQPKTPQPKAASAVAGRRPEKAAPKKPAGERIRPKKGDKTPRPDKSIRKDAVDAKAKGVVEPKTKEPVETKAKSPGEPKITEPAVPKTKEPAEPEGKLPAT